MKLERASLGHIYFLGSKFLEERMLLGFPFRLVTIALLQEWDLCGLANAEMVPDLISKLSPDLIR